MSIPRILQILAFEFRRRSYPSHPVLDSSSISRPHRHTPSFHHSATFDTSAPFVDSLFPSSLLSLSSKNKDSPQHRYPLLPLFPVSSLLWNPIWFLFLRNHLFLWKPFLRGHSLLSLNFIRSSSPFSAPFPTGLSLLKVIGGFGGGGLEVTGALLVIPASNLTFLSP